MNYPRIPMHFVGGIADFSEMLVSIEILRGRDREAANQLCRLIPTILREAPCFLDRMTGRWLYDFGEPITTESGYVWGVGKTWHQLTILIDVVACAVKRLEAAVLADYLTRLSDPRKHDDMVFEFAPILHLRREPGFIPISNRSASR